MEMATALHVARKESKFMSTHLELALFLDLGMRLV